LLRDVEHEQQRTSLTKLIDQANKAWHGVRLFQPDWGDGSHSLALEAELKKEGLRFFWILNAYWEPLNFELPKLNGAGVWRRWIDTALDSPNDILSWQNAAVVSTAAYPAEARSVVVLYADKKG
jgi:glycogen operon protein